MEGDAGRLHTWVSPDRQTVRRFAQLALLPRPPLATVAGPSCPADRGHPERCPDGCWCACHRA